MCYCLKRKIYGLSNGSSVRSLIANAGAIRVSASGRSCASGSASAARSAAGSAQERIADALHGHRAPRSVAANEGYIITER
jgi:hypothetical protein